MNTVTQILKAKGKSVWTISPEAPVTELHALENALAQLGVPFGDFHSERFNLA